MKSLIDYYDDFAEMWAERWYANESLLPYLKQFVELLPKKARVLDLCCGAGYESMRLSKLGVNVVGADLSEKSIELARQHNPQIEFYIKDMLKSYADLGMFDGLACIAGLVHLPEDKMELAFKNMYEVLKDNSYLFIVVRNGDKITKSVEVEGIEDGIIDNRDQEQECRQDPGQTVYLSHGFFLNFFHWKITSIVRKKDPDTMLGAFACP